jgi:hypothetical protein
MTRHRGHRRPERYEDLAEEEVQQARAAVHQGERSRGRSYADEQPRSWLGRRARSIRERLSHRPQEKEEPGRLERAKAWVNKEVKGGISEVKEELGLEEAMAARMAGSKVKKIRKAGRSIQRTARKISGARGPPAFLQAMRPGPPGMISARSVARPGGPHFMQSVTQGSVPSRGPRRRAEPPAPNPLRQAFVGSGHGRDYNPVHIMGWNGPAKPRQPRRRARGPTVIIYAGGQAPRKKRAKAPRGRPVGLRW